MKSQKSYFVKFPCGNGKYRTTGIIGSPEKTFMSGGVVRFVDTQTGEAFRLINDRLVEISRREIAAA